MTREFSPILVASDASNESEEGKNSATVSNTSTQTSSVQKAINTIDEDHLPIHDMLELQLASFPLYKTHQDEHKLFSAENPEVNNIKERLFPHLTGLTLFGKDKIEYRSPTLYFISDEYLTNPPNEIQGAPSTIESNGSTPESTSSRPQSNFSITYLHLGDQLSGHRGIIHGGLLATLLDEITCRLAFLSFPSRRGVTANLNINYKKPTLVNNWICIKCQVIKKQGRKCWVKGEVFGVDEKTKELNEEDIRCWCEILIVEPRWVEELKNGEGN